MICLLIFLKIELQKKLSARNEIEASKKKIEWGSQIRNYVLHHRAVLHTALRTTSDEPVFIDGKNIIPSIIKSRQKIKTFTDDVISGKIKSHTNKIFTDVVNIGIGGSDLGPVMVVESLKYYRSRLKSHFV